MKGLIVATAVFLSLAISLPAAASSFTVEPELARVQSLTVSVQDNVRDGCLPDPDALKTEAELVLRQSDLKVLDESDAAADPESKYSVFLTALGYKTPQGLCIVSFSAEVWRFSFLKEGHGAPVVAFQWGTLLSGPTGDMQSRLREQAHIAASEIANEILKARAP